MNHPPEDNFPKTKTMFSRPFRAPVSSRLVSLVTRFQNAFSRTSKCQLPGFPRRDEADDITIYIFLFIVLDNCSFNTSNSLFYSVWDDQSTFESWLARWKATSLWDQRPRITEGCSASGIQWSMASSPTGTTWRGSGHTFTAK